MCKKMFDFNSESNKYLFTCMQLYRIKIRILNLQDIRTLTHETLPYSVNEDGTAVRNFIHKNLADYLLSAFT